MDSLKFLVAANIILLVANLVWANANRDGIKVSSDLIKANLQFAKTLQEQYRLIQYNAREVAACTDDLLRHADNLGVIIHPRELPPLNIVQVEIPDAQLRVHS